MAITQNTYPSKAQKGLPGMKANMEEWNAITRVQEDAVAIGFGQPVARSATAKDDACRIFAAGRSFLGLTIKDTTRPATVGDAYERYSNVGILTQGVMWVTAGGACTAGNPVYWDPATLKFVDDNTKVAIPGAVFDSSGVLNDVVKVAIR